MWNEIGIVVLLASDASWLLIITLLVGRPKGPRSTEPLRLLPDLLRLLPDLLRLLRRLAADPDLPRGVRIRPGLLLAYLATPVDRISDFIPVLGHTDDAIIVTAVLRGVVRHTGLGAVRRHWPGTDDGFAALCRLTGLGEQAVRVCGSPRSRSGAARSGRSPASC
jgi:uncharacterized membrane protein YkvA (DUF1232 family)